MKDDEIPEQWLQDWFEQVAIDQRLAQSITNFGELNERLSRLTAANKRTDDVARVGLKHAQEIYDLLLEADLFAANRSVSLDARASMRPDVILVTASAHYILVELKTRREAERQGVQELLAYSTAMKLRYPYVNDFLYVIVGGAWDLLLSRSVQSLILAGKRVLPLQWTLTELEEPIAQMTDDAKRRAILLEKLKLKIRLDLYELNFVQPYDPMHAITTATLAVSRNIRLAPGVLKYFHQLAYRTATDCAQMQQSGFAIVWLDKDMEYPYEIVNITLATVNQHWVENVSLPEGYSLPDMVPQRGIPRLAHRLAAARRKAMMTGTAEDDFFAEAAASQAAQELFPQSSLSHEVLQRHQSEDAERRLRVAMRDVGAFELGGLMTLKQFAHVLEKKQGWVDVKNFFVFGEFADFITTEPYSGIPQVDELLDILKHFQVHKGYGSPAPRVS